MSIDPESLRDGSQEKGNTYFGRKLGRKGLIKYEKCCLQQELGIYFLVVFFFISLKFGVRSSNVCNVAASHRMDQQ